MHEEEVQEPFQQLCSDSHSPLANHGTGTNPFTTTSSTGNGSAVISWNCVYAAEYLGLRCRNQEAVGRTRWCSVKNDRHQRMTDYGKNILNFEGGVIEYVGWKESITPYVEEETDQVRMFMTLKKHLKKDALKMVEHIYLGTFRMPGNRLIAALDDVYAQPQQIINAFHTRLEKDASNERRSGLS